MNTKSCKVCGEEKEFSAFYKDKRLIDGVRGKCKTCCRIYKKEYKSKNRERLLTQDNARRKKNVEVVRRKEREWYANRTEEQVEAKRKYRKQYCKDNAHLFRAYANDRRAQKQQAKPKWANNKYISLFYYLAKLEENRIGESVHVDHIIPLNNKYVCGLHCEDNLQLLTATENLRKYNSHVKRKEPDVT